MQNSFNEKHNGLSRGAACNFSMLLNYWGEKEENELWSINLFIHNYPSASLSHTLSLCQPVSVSVLYYTSLNGTKLTNAPWRHPPSAKCPIVFFHNTPLNP